MKALPVAIAIGCIQNGTMAGKLNGVMPATTPRGWRTVWASTPVETFSEKPPLRSWVMEVANSRVSRPRAISPLASPMVLPCSREIATAISSVLSSISWRMRNRIWVRLASDTFAHSRWASAAERTAWSTVSAPPRCRVPTSAPVAGFMIGCVEPAVATSWPPIQCVISYPMVNLLRCVDAAGGAADEGRGAVGSEVVALRCPLVLVDAAGGLRGLQSRDLRDRDVPPAVAGRVGPVQVGVDHDRGGLVRGLGAAVGLAEGRGVPDLLDLDAVGADVGRDVQRDQAPVQQAGVLVAHAVLGAEALAAE